MAQQNRSGNWMARRTRNGETYQLGTFASRQEAEGAEYRFDRNWPTNHGKRRTATYWQAVDLIGQEAVDKLYAAGLKVRKKDLTYRR